MRTLSLFLSSALAVVPAAQETASPAGEQAGPVVSHDGLDFSSWQEYTQSNAFRALGLRCGLSDRPERMANLGPSAAFRGPGDCTYTRTNINPIYEPDAAEVIEIPVVFHVLSNTSGTGNMKTSRVLEQIEVLNEDFRALAGSLGAPGVDTRIQFYLATVDPDGNPTNGIVRTTNNNWFNDNGNYWDSLAWDTNKYMNVYSNQASGALGYVPDLPQGGIAGSNFDRVVVLYSTVGRNAPIGPPFHKGRTLTHEVGHYFGLEHTFTGGCSGSNCYTSGDLICDTNKEQNPTNGCPANKSSCGTPDPITNYMDYSNDLCMTGFTAEQANRMRCSIKNYRSNLPTSICAGAATSSIRNAGSNPNVFTATLPIVADTQILDVATAPYSFATIVGYAGAGTLALSGGQTLLVDASSTRYFRLGPLSGPNASAEVSVPHDTSLCGVSFSMQALLTGGASPFALTNAIDQTVGRNP